MTKQIIALMLLISAPALADDGAPRESYASALAGPAITTSSGGGNVFTLGARIGTSLHSAESGILALGLYIAEASKTTSVGAITADGSSVLIAAEILDRKAFGTGLYFGGRLGISLDNVTLSARSVAYSASATGFEIGPAAGYEFPISPVLNFDLDISWLTSNAETLTFPAAGSIHVDPSSGFIFQGGVTFHW